MPIWTLSSPGFSYLRGLSWTGAPTLCIASFPNLVARAHGRVVRHHIRSHPSSLHPIQHGQQQLPRADASHPKHDRVKREGVGTRVVPRLAHFVHEGKSGLPLATLSARVHRRVVADSGVEKISREDETGRGEEAEGEREGGRGGEDRCERQTLPKGSP